MKRPGCEENSACRRWHRCRALALSFFCALFFSAPAVAATETAAARAPEEQSQSAFCTPMQARKTINDMRHKPVRQITYQYYWKKKDKYKQNKNKGEEDRAKDFFEKLSQKLELSAETKAFIAVMGKFFILTLTGGAVVFFLFNARMQSAFGRARARAEQDGAEAASAKIFGLDVRPGSLPACPDEESLRLFSMGKHREALALLYRAALSRCLHNQKARQRARIKSSMTEMECLRLLTQTLEPERFDYVTKLTAAWLRTAYAHAPVEEEDFVRLARGWKEAFA